MFVDYQKSKETCEFGPFEYSLYLLVSALWLVDFAGEVLISSRLWNLLFQDERVENWTSPK